MGALTWIVLVTAFVAITEAVNPLSRYGPCKEVKPCTDFELKDFEGVWYLQKRPKGKGSKSHTCQACYEKATKNLHSFLYYYNEGEPRNDPIHAEYECVDGAKGKYHGQITVENQPVHIFWHVLYVDNDSRVTYMCTNHPDANPNLDAVFIWTREQCPDQSVVDRAHAKLREYSELSCEMESAEQSLDKCSPLDVYDSLQDPSKFIKTTHTIE